jgi:hypothetical protein
MTVLLQIVAPLVFSLPFPLVDAWEAATSARLAARLDAIRAAGEPMTLADLAKTYPEPPPGKNAAPLYAAAFKILADPRIEQWPADKLPIQGIASLPKADEEFPPNLLANVRDYLHECRAALKVLHDAAPLEECWFDLHFDQGIGKAANTFLPHLAAMRNGARHLALESVERTESGRPDEAAEALWAALRVGHALRREPVLASCLVRMACDALAVTYIEHLVSRGRPSAPKLEKLESALRAEADPKMMERLFIVQRCWSMDSYKENFLKPGGRGFDALGFPVPLAFRLIPRTYLKADMVEYIDLMNQYVAAAKKPYPQSCLEGTRIGGKIDEQIPRYYIIICRMNLPALGRVFTEAQRHMARLESARVALAALRYKAKSGRLPDKLGDLAPDFLDAVPLDPFDGQPLRYLRDANGFVIYAVGENGKDDGGDFDLNRQTWRFLDIGFRVRWPKSRF